MDQLWAEAVVRFREGESLFLPNDMELEARRRQELHNELAGDERRGMIEAFVRKSIPVTWDSLTMAQRRDWFRLSAGLASDEPQKRRETICAVEVLVECFGQQLDEKTRYKTKDINQIMRELDCLEYAGRSRDSVYGLQRRFRILSDPE